MGLLAPSLEHDSKLYQLFFHPTTFIRHYSSSGKCLEAFEAEQEVTTQVDERANPHRTSPTSDLKHLLIHSITPFFASPPASSHPALSSIHRPILTALSFVAGPEHDLELYHPFFPQRSLDNTPPPEKAGKRLRGSKRGQFKSTQGETIVARLRRLVSTSQ